MYKVGGKSIQDIFALFTGFNKLLKKGRIILHWTQNVWWNIHSQVQTYIRESFQGKPYAEKIDDQFKFFKTNSEDLDKKWSEATRNHALNHTTREVSKFISVEFRKDTHSCLWLLKIILQNELYSFWQSVIFEENIDTVIEIKHRFQRPDFLNKLQPKTAGNKHGLAHLCNVPYLME